MFLNTLLVIEDNRDNREILRDLLTRRIDSLIGSG